MPIDTVTILIEVRQIDHFGGQPAVGAFHRFIAPDIGPAEMRVEGFEGRTDGPGLVPLRRSR